MHVPIDQKIGLRFRWHNRKAFFTFIRIISFSSVKYAYLNIHNIYTDEPYLFSSS